MKFFFSFLFIGGLYLSSTAQLYKEFESGTFRVGYTDTLLYDTAHHYEAFGYNGPAPIFVQIWHPQPKKASTPKLRFDELKFQEVPADLKLVYDSLQRHMDTAQIDYSIQRTIDDWSKIDYSPNTVKTVISAIEKIPVQSYREALPKSSDYPVILYHHGAQGRSDENHVMAEFFASRGYIFISANYHLPYEGLGYGSSNNFGQSFTDIKTVIAYAKSISTSDKMAFIGHSWGAQAGWKYLPNTTDFDAFVSLETTIEYKTIDEEARIKEMWPTVYEVYKEKDELMPYPTLIFANTMEDKPFWFFAGEGSGGMIHATEMQAFNHESYTSIFFLRSDILQRFRAPDQEPLERERALYYRHLSMIEDFLTNCNTSPLLLKGDYPDFYLHYEPAKP